LSNSGADCGIAFIIIAIVDFVIGAIRRLAMQDSAFGPLWYLRSGNHLAIVEAITSLLTVSSKRWWVIPLIQGALIC
jgi:hypothetical protein